MSKKKALKLKDSNVLSISKVIFLLSGSAILFALLLSGSTYIVQKRSVQI